MSGDTKPDSPRWYSVTADGRATLCASESDARDCAETSDMMWARSGPHAAVQLVDAAPLHAEIERLTAELEVLRARIAEAEGQEPGAWKWAGVLIRAEESHPLHRNNGTPLFYRPIPAPAAEKRIAEPVGEMPDSLFAGMPDSYRREAWRIYCQTIPAPAAGVLEWQPIGTAPKPGVRVLLWWVGEVHTGQCRGVGASRDGGDWWTSESKQVFGVDDGRPTHWMPLPDAPKQAEGGA